MKNIISILILGFLIVLTLNFVSAAGLVSPYWSDNPLKIYYGETKTIEFTLQNMVGNEDVTVKAAISEGNDIASLEQELPTTFTAKAGTENTKIPIKIAIPENYGKSMQKVRLDVNPVTSGEGGMIKLGTGWSTAFDVIISEKPKEKPKLTGTLIWIILVLIVAVIIVAVVYLAIRKKGR